MRASQFPPKTLAHWKATGPSWQTRMAETLKKAVYARIKTEYEPVIDKEDRETGLRVAYNADFMVAYGINHVLNFIRANPSSQTVSRDRLRQRMEPNIRRNDAHTCQINCRVSPNRISYFGLCAAQATEFARKPASKGRAGIDSESI